MNKVDLTGKQFHSWTVLSVNNDWEKGPRFYNCVCKCGRLKRVIGSSLVNGKSTSCRKGACNYKYKHRNIEIGNTFGHWTIISNRVLNKVECKCVCGNEKFVSISILFNGKSKSCGCRRIPYMVKNEQP